MIYENQKVINEEGKEFAKSIGAFFQSTSAKKDIGITSLFENIGQKFFNPNYGQKLQENFFNPNYEQQKQEKLFKLEKYKLL